MSEASQALLLRALTQADAPAFAEAALASVDSVGPWLPWCHAGYSVAQALDWVDWCEAHLAAGDAHEFGIFNAASGELLGGCGLNAIDHGHRFCNLGYWVRSSAQRRGVASFCVQQLAVLAFEVLNLQRVEIVVAVGNHASAAVARRCGAHFEGIAHQRLWLHGRAVDAQMFALTRPDAQDTACNTV